MIALHLREKWVLVTGASSGLGKEIAKQLARDYHSNLIIVARRTVQLESLREELESQYNIQIKVLTADLSVKEDVLRVFQYSTTEVFLSAAILNAGITYFGRDKLILESDLDNILQTNIAAMAILMQRFAKYFDERGKEAGLMVVSSMAAISPAPYQSLYSGSKAFIYAYAQALSAELENPDFSISIFTPGGIQTEMTANGNFDGLEKWLMPVDKVARIGISEFVRRKLVIVPGFSNKIGAVFLKFIPKRFLLGKLGVIYRKTLERTSKGV